MKRLGTSTIGAAAAALFAGALLTAPANAAPAVSPGATQGVTKAAPDNIQQVRRGWHGHRHRGGWGRGWGWGAGAAAAGLLLTAPYWANDGYAYDRSEDYDDEYAESSGGGYARCEATFRSFDPGTGTYVGYDGVRRTCPYL